MITLPQRFLMASNRGRSRKRFEVGHVGKPEEKNARRCDHKYQPGAYAQDALVQILDLLLSICCLPTAYAPFDKLRASVGFILSPLCGAGSLRSKGLFCAEDFFQELCGLGGGILADFAFFDSENQEESVESFVDDVFVEVKLAGQDTAAGGFFDDAVVLADDSDTLQGTMDDGGEGGGEVGRTGAAEVVGGGGFVAGEDAAGVVEGHLFEGGEKDWLGLGGGLLGGAVHADFQVVDLFALAQQAHALAEGLDVGWQENTDVFVLEESVVLASKTYGLGGADLEGLFESGDDFFVAEGMVELGGGQGGAESQSEREQGRAQGISHG